MRSNSSRCRRCSRRRGGRDTAQVGTVGADPLEAAFAGCQGGAGNDLLRSPFGGEGVLVIDAGGEAGRLAEAGALLPVQLLAPAFAFPALVQVGDVPAGIDLPVLGYPREGLVPAIGEDDGVARLHGGREERDGGHHHHHHQHETRTENGTTDDGLRHGTSTSSIERN